MLNMFKYKVMSWDYLSRKIYPCNFRMDGMHATSFSLYKCNSMSLSDHEDKVVRLFKSETLLEIRNMKRSFILLPMLMRMHSNSMVHMLTTWVESLSSYCTLKTNLDVVFDSLGAHS